MQTKTLMIQATTSDAGKSTLVANLYRSFSQRGIRVAPFKPQNMALNSAVAADGGEIGRAQAVQAQAAGIASSHDMNPVLLKSNSDTGSQVIIQGYVIDIMEAGRYHDYKSVAKKAVLVQLTEEERLRSYVGKLLENKILITRGERKGTQYLINSELIKASSLNIKPSLKTIEIHSLKALIQQDLKIHPDSKIGEIYSRIPDIAYKDLQKAIYQLVNEGILNHTPDKAHRKYCLAKKIENKSALLHKYQINNIMIDNNMSTKWNYGKETTLQSKKLERI